MTHRKLKYLRQILGLTQDEIAEWMGISQSKYCKLESNRLKITYDEEKKILLLFKMRRAKEIEQLHEEIKLLNNLF